MVDPHLVDLQDITRIFFEHLSLGSKIHELKRSCLFSSTNNAWEWIPTIHHCI